MTRPTKEWRPTDYQMAVLRTLPAYGSVKISGMGGSPSHLVAALRLLEERGLVHNGGDVGRYEKWGITKAGRDLLDAAHVHGLRPC